MQKNLVLTGHYDGLVDAELGPATLRAISGFERAVGGRPNGRLDREEREQLDKLGQEAYDAMGMDRVSLDDAGVYVYAPRALLDQPIDESGGGLTLSTRDEGFSLRLNGWPYSSRKLAALKGDLLEPRAGQRIAYRAFGDSYAVASGTAGDSSFYSFVTVDADRIVGVDVVWTNEYQRAGRIAATFAISYSGATKSLETEEPAPPVGETPPMRRTADAAREAYRRAADADVAPPPRETIKEPHDPSAAAGNQKFGPFVVPAGSGTDILLADTIEPGATLDFRRALRAQPGATTLVLSSPGGSVNEGLLLAHLVADRKLSTYIPQGAGCYSACAYIFFAGAERLADGELGVHQIYGEGVDASDTQVVLSDVLDALDEFGVPQEVVSTMLRTRPEQMYIFTPAELEKLSSRSARAAAEGAARDQGL